MTGRSEYCTIILVRRLTMSSLLMLWPEYRENASTEIRVTEHASALRVQLTQHSLHILHSNPSVHFRKGREARKWRNKVTRMERHTYAVERLLNPLKPNGNETSRVFKQTKTSFSVYGFCMLDTVNRDYFLNCINQLIFALFLQHGLNSQIQFRLLSASNNCSSIDQWKACYYNSQRLTSDLMAGQRPPDSVCCCVTTGNPHRPWIFPHPFV